MSRLRLYTLSTRVLAMLFFVLLAGVRANVRVFQRYESSPWELEWLAHIENEWHDNECNVLKRDEQRQRALWSVYNTQTRLHLAARNSPPPKNFTDDEIYSKLYYRQGAHLVVELIEPLVGILRDPLTICEGMPPIAHDAFLPLDSAMQSKRWILLQPAASADAERPATLPTNGRRLLFDFGASTYSGWKGSPATVGARWLVERYADLGLEFDHVYSFEASVQKPQDVFAGVPADLLPRYSYYNLGVESDPASIRNPLTFIAAVASPGDHVTVKLDIDSPAIENAIMRYLLESPALQALIDEMFFEHHVETAAMKKHWGSIFEKGAYMYDTYAMFLQLRKSGIRMHSWP